LIVRLASYFDPLRFFLPASLVFLALGFLRAIRDVIVVNQFGALSVILFLTAFQIFVLGVIADVIVRRFQVVPTAPQRPAVRDSAGERPVEEVKQLALRDDARVRRMEGSAMAEAKVANE
jgi:hypothetical protein